MAISSSVLFSLGFLFLSFPLFPGREMEQKSALSPAVCYDKSWFKRQVKSSKSWFLVALSILNLGSWLFLCYAGLNSWFSSAKGGLRLSRFSNPTPVRPCYLFFLFPLVECNLRLYLCFLPAFETFLTLRPLGCNSSGVNFNWKFQLHCARFVHRCEEKGKSKTAKKTKNPKPE